MKTFLILVASISFCFAQTPKGQTIAYFNKEGQTLTNSSGATSFRTVEGTAGKYIIRDYLISGVLQMEAECSAYTPELIQEGKTTSYYESGQLEEESIYVGGKKNGPSRSFYKNGKLKADLTYTDGNSRYNHYYAVDGHDYLVNGTGIYPDTLSFSSYRATYHEVVDHESVGSFFIENNDTLYLIVEQQAEYKGGLTQLGSDIGSRLTYPKSARRSGHQGNVFIAFTVRKDGTVADAMVVKGIHPDCDAEALRVVKTLNSWKPAEHHNKKVHSKFVIPIRFKLEG